MRSDYVLYGVAVIFFIIAGAVAAAQIPGYELTATNGIVVIMLFLLIGIISAAVGYSVRPKAIMPTTYPSPTPATIEAQETPTPAEPLPEETPTLPPPSPPTPPAAEEVTQEPSPPSPPPPEEISVTPTAEPEQPMKPPEEEKPKPARRRRRKKASG